MSLGGSGEAQPGGTRARKTYIFLLISKSRGPFGFAGAEKEEEGSENEKEVGEKKGVRNRRPCVALRNQFFAQTG